MTDVITLVRPRDVIAEWSYFAPLIQQVIDKVGGGQYADDVLTCVQRGVMQVWRISDDRGMVVTELQTFPRFGILLVYMVAGEHAPDWIAQGQQQLEAFAKSHGCRFMEFLGRPGWERYTRPLGYDHKLVRMRKEL
jgi:hypothetical protein